MSDAFFTNPRPFTKRKREDAPSSSRNGVRGGGRGSSRGASRGASSRGGASRGGGASSRGRGGASRGRGGKTEQGGERKGKRRADDDEELDELDGMNGGFDSDDGMDEPLEEEEVDESEEDDDNETPAQKRLRLSQMYLKTLEKDTRLEDSGFDAADLDRDIIAERLQQDVLEHSGKLHLNVAESLQLPIPSSSVYTTPSKAHRGPVSAAVASEDGQWLYTASKDGSIIKWDLRSILSAPSTSTISTAGAITKAVYFPKKPSEVVEDPDAPKKTSAKGKGKAPKPEEKGGHRGEVLSLAVSFDGKVLASGGSDKMIGVWDVEGEGGKWLRGLGGHKDKVASLAFRLGTLQLYSTSFDRTMKLFDLSTLSYIETLFGHQDCIQHVSALRSEVAVSAGGRDKTIRFWKVNEESQLVFRGGVASRIRNVLDGAMEEDGIEEEVGGKRRRARGEVKFVEGSVDCVAMIDDTTFLSGGDSGSICMWTITKKKPISTTQLAHGVNEYASETEGIIGTARWITALACLSYGDTFASGSWDGVIRLWKIDEKVRSFSPLTTISALGYINSLQLISPTLRSSAPQSQRDGKSQQKSLMVVAAVGKEPRLGRWMRIKEGREGAVVAVIPIGDAPRITEL